MVIASQDKYIRYMSQCYVGVSHDYSILKTEFPPEKDWFEHHIIRVDLGYQGFGNDYNCEKLIISAKKPRKRELSESAQYQNKEKSKERIKVEHSIGGLKRYRILSERLRHHDIQLYNDIIEVCAGLWNFNIKF